MERQRSESMKLRMNTKYDKENMDVCGLFPQVPRPIIHQLAEENLQDEFSN